MSKFAERLKELREEKNLSQTKFAEAIGVSKSAVAFWENNTSRITDENLIKVAKYFGVTTDYLLGLSEH